MDVTELVTGMEDLLRRSLGPTVELATSFELDLPPAYTDAGQLESALLNLAVNARDAMAGGGVIRIEAGLERLEKAGLISLSPGEYVRLSVIDNGAGMDADTLQRATEPFFTTKGVGKGTGLGLSMVHGLAEQSGGRLRISSRPGRGTRVDIWLPKAAMVGAGKPRRDEVDDTGPMPRLHVLAVDDDPLVLSNLVAMLEELGQKVTPAASAAEALVAMAQKPADLVITDYAMPQTTGLQLAQEIFSTHPDAAVVLSTGYAELPPGAEFDLPRLSKPYSQTDLARALRHARRRAELHRA